MLSFDLQSSTEITPTTTNSSPFSTSDFFALPSVNPSNATVFSANNVPTIKVSTSVSVAPSTDTKLQTTTLKSQFTKDFNAGHREVWDLNQNSRISDRNRKGHVEEEEAEEEELMEKEESGGLESTSRVARFPRSVMRPLSWYANPQWAITGGVLEILLLVYLLRSWNIVESSFFRIGPPIQLFQYTIEDEKEYIGILFVFFVHQLVFTWLSEVVAPWILNEIQDPKCRTLTFSKSQSILMMNLYYIYFTINSFLLVNISLSQISFLVTILAADLIAVTVVNMHYVWNKKSFSSNHFISKLIELLMWNRRWNSTYDRRATLKEESDLEMHMNLV